MRKVALNLFAVAALLLPNALVARDDSPPPLTAEHDAGKQAVATKNWPAALKALTAAEKNEPRNADVQNLLGFTYRNMGNLDLAFKHYERALALDPKHLGAHEYVGEAWLMVNNLPKAEEHLAALKAHCTRVCEERDDLENAIKAYRARAQAKGSK